MLSAIGYFATTLASTMFWPIVLATLVIGVIGWKSWEDRDRLTYGSPEYGSATWRMWASTQGICVMWIAYAILSSVPGPNYQIKTEVKYVEKTISSKYNEAYQNCIDSVNRNAFGTTEQDTLKGEHAFCNNQALSFVNMKPVQIPVVKERVVVTLAPKEERYRTLFNTCMGKDVTGGEYWSVDLEDAEMKKSNLTGPELRNTRIKLCHAQTKEIVQ